MKIKTDGSKIEIDLSDLFSELPREEQLKLVDHLVLEDEIVKQVVQLLTTGSTDAGSWMGHCSGDAVEKARASLLEHFKDVAHEVVKYALWDRDNALTARAQHEEWAWKLYHAWPDHLWHARPQLQSLPMSAYRWPTEESIRAALKREA